ncbi:GNAT family N-acetyltransferase [Lewinellaceae bacterium SD302]|nr:GNAT family N-acetyltransferase [Lewinellaceae bacterium SD302]
MLLSTPRLCLRPLTPGDASHFFRLNEDPEVMRYLPEERFENEAAARSFLETYPDSQPPGYGRLAVLDEVNGHWLGWCGLKYHPQIDDVDLGFRFYRQYWGQGYATEAGRRCLEYGFNDLGLNSVYAHVDAANVGSQRALEKCGFLRSGTFTETDWSGWSYRLERERWLLVR